MISYITPTPIVPTEIDAGTPVWLSVVVCVIILVPLSGLCITVFKIIRDDYNESKRKRSYRA